MDIIKKIDSIVEAKKCPEGQKWWALKGKCIPVEEHKKMMRKMRGDE